MVAREGIAGNLRDVLELPIFVFYRICDNFKEHYPQHVALSGIVKGFSGGEEAETPVKKREWVDGVDDFPPGYKGEMDLSQEEAWKVWLGNGGRWLEKSEEVM